MIKIVLSKFCLNIQQKIESYLFDEDHFIKRYKKELNKLREKIQFFEQQKRNKDHQKELEKLKLDPDCNSNIYIICSKFKETEYENMRDILQQCYPDILSILDDNNSHFEYIEVTFTIGNIQCQFHNSFKDWDRYLYIGDDLALSEYTWYGLKNSTLQKINDVCGISATMDDIHQALNFILSGYGGFYLFDIIDDV
jgi:hypothetical protein